MDKEEEIIYIQEEVIQESGENITEKQQISQIDQQESFQDQLRPRPAFHIEEDNQNLTEEERQAFSYILSVRTEKESLVANKRKNKSSIQTIQCHEIKGSQNQHIINPVKICYNEQFAENIYQKLLKWRAETIQNWRCVVKNLQYLHKTKKPQHSIKEKLTVQCLNKVPEIYKISMNKWLNLPQIESLLTHFSNSKYQTLENLIENKKDCDFSDNYHLWIYSLLALHQSYAFYTNFLALASINACIEKQFYYIEQYYKEKQTLQNEKNTIEGNLVKWITTVVLLIQVFNQKNLKKYLHLLQLSKCL